MKLIYLNLSKQIDIDGNAIITIFVVDEAVLQT